MTKTLLALTAALAISMPAAAMAAEKNTDIRTQAQVGIDRTTTGSVQRGVACDGASKTLGCRFENRERDRRFPSAPVMPQFGF